MHAAEAGISIDTVRTCAAARIPLLGICLGHQAIATAYGAAVIRAPRPVHGMAFPVRHDGRGVLAGQPHPFHATRYHSLIVDEATLPSGPRVTAVTGRIPMGLRHTTDPVEGIQFHPESILTTHGRQLVHTFVQSALNRQPSRATRLGSPLTGSFLDDAAHLSLWRSDQARSGVLVSDVQNMKPPLQTRVCALM